MVKVDLDDMRLVRFELTDVWHMDARGEALIAGEGAGKQPLAIAFEWAVIEPGCYVMSRPTELVTNMLLFDGALILREELVMLGLLEVVTQLDWQTSVSRALSASGTRSRARTSGPARRRPSGSLEPT